MAKAKPKANELESIQNALADQKLSWTAGGSFLTALPEEERKKHLGFVPAPKDPSLHEMEYNAAANLKAYQSSEASKSFGAPAAVDWRNVSGQNYVTPVRNQGSCGSCTAFSSIAAVESKVKILRGSSYPIDLSEAHLYYCIARSQGRTCTTGWWLEPPLVPLRDIGVADDACYPYVGGDQNCTGLCSDWASRVVKITGYTKLTTIATMKDWIANNGPVQTSLNIYNDFYSYTSGVYTKSANTTLQGAQAVCVVGYNDAQGCWICKNSWTTAWGESGFFRIAYGQCGIEATMWGINGIVDTRWIRGKKVTGLWANTADKNAYVYLSDEGWKRISNSNNDAFLNTLNQLAAAKAANSNVDVYLDNGLITIVYVF